MSTDLQIYNLALHRLGCEKVSAVGDTSKRAVLLTDLYEVVRDNLLKKYDWSFAQKEVTLTVSDITVSTPFTYEFEYNLPADTLRIISEYGGEIYKANGLLVQSDAETLQLVYISKITAEASFSVEFVKSFYLELAAEASISLVQDKELRNSLLVEAEKVALDGVFTDSKSSSPQNYEITDFTDVRL